MASPLLHHSKTLISLFFLLFIYHATAMGTLISFTPIKANCSSTKYTEDSNFSTNLQTLFSTLKTKSSSSISINETSGEPSATAFGLFFCTGDLSQDNCKACIHTAIQDITDSCPSSKQGIIWYDYCELRYSDTNFFGVPDTNGFSMINPNENTSSSRPVEVVSQLVKEAPLVHPLMFKAEALISESLYALAQCSPDLTRQGCSDCLITILASIKACCTDAKGWRYLAPSCWIRYEATPFLQNLNDKHRAITQSYCSSNDLIPSNGLNATTTLVSTLLSNLTEKAPEMTGFYSSTSVFRENKNDLYGLALCRGDLQTKKDECQSCLKNASKSIVEDCPNKTQAIEWYEKCFIRYSDQRFFGTVSSDGRTLCGREQITQEVDNTTVALAFNLINDAPNSPMFFRAGQHMSAYVLVQCTRDLSKEGCSQCLQRGMNKVLSDCKQTNGWRYLSGSCTLRYEDYSFFDTASLSSPSPGISLPPEKDGASMKKTSTISFAAAVTSVLAVIILFPIYY